MLTLRYDPSKKPLSAPFTINDFTPKETLDPESEVVEIIKETFLRAREQLKFDRVSMSLSAGADSGLTLAMLRSTLPDVKVDCVSMGFGDKDDEVARAQEISRIYDCDFHGIIKQDVLSELPKLISIVKEPRWNIYQYYAFEQGRKSSSVMYSGDSGDELFGGYTFRYQKFLSLLPGNATWKDKVKIYLSCHERDWVPEQHKIFGEKIAFSWDNIHLIFKPYFDNDLPPLDQVFLADCNGKLLYDWIPVNKSLSASLDLRIESTFLTDAMRSLATHVPWQMKYDPATAVGKKILYSILVKCKGFEKSKPSKKGFGMNLVSLWQRHAKEIVKAYVNSDSEIVKSKIISDRWVAATVAKLLDTDEPDPRYINKMLALLALEVWHRIFIGRTMKSNYKL